MTNFGSLGWVSDEQGYRYEKFHPHTGVAWPAIPPMLLELWAETNYNAAPEACLVNFYRVGTRMGLHRDADEEAREAPVLSVSLGDSALFRMVGPRERPHALAHASIWRRVGIRGPGAHGHHGIDKVLAGSSRLIPEGGRLNLTMRRVTMSEQIKRRPVRRDRASNAPLRAGTGRG